MNKDKLFSMMPKEIIEKSEVNEKIEEQRNLVKAGKNFVSQFSINRFLHKKLADFDVNEILHLFSKLNEFDFVINENELFFYGLDIDSFACILEETFNLKDMYELDNFYIESLLRGKDISKEAVLIDNENVTFDEIFEKFVFQSFAMTAMDAANLNLILVAKKALLGSFLAEKNVESLLKGQKEIYNISVLM